MIVITQTIFGCYKRVLPIKFEGNNSFESAADLGTVSKYTAFPGLTVSQALPDWYKFKLAKTGQSVDQIKISFLNSDGDIDVELYNSTQGYVAGSYTANNLETISLSGLTAGEYYYLRVYQYSGTPNEQYSVTFDISEKIVDIIDRFEPNNVISSATNLGTVSSIDSQFDLTMSPQDSDWYYFYLDGSNPYLNTISIQFNQLEPGLTCKLYSADGVTLLQQFFFNGEFNVSSLPPGIYYINISSTNQATRFLAYSIQFKHSDLGNYMYGQYSGSSAFRWWGIINGSTDAFTLLNDNNAPIIGSGDGLFYSGSYPRNLFSMNGGFPVLVRSINYNVIPQSYSYESNKLVEIGNTSTRTINEYEYYLNGVFVGVEYNEYVGGKYVTTTQGEFTYKTNTLVSYLSQSSFDKLPNIGEYNTIKWSTYIAHNTAVLRVRDVATDSTTDIGAFDSTDEIPLISYDGSTYSTNTYVDIDSSGIALNIPKTVFVNSSGVTVKEQIIFSTARPLAARINRGTNNYTINNYVCKALSRNGKYAVLTNAGYDYNRPIVLASSFYNSYTSQWEHQYRYPDVQNPVVNVMDLDTGTMVFSHQWNVPINVDKSVKILSDGSVVYPALDDDNNWAIFKKPLGSARVKIMTLPVEVLDPVSGIKKMNLSDSGELACFEQNSLFVFRGELKSISDSSMNILGVI